MYVDFVGDEVDEDFADVELAQVGIVELVEVPLPSGKPCTNCNNSRIEPSRQFMLISCQCDKNCGKKFHCKRDCADPLPNAQQRTGTDRWISQCCRE